MENYLSRYAWPAQRLLESAISRLNQSQFGQADGSDRSFAWADLAMVVVIPAFKEDALQSILEDLLDCDKTTGAVEVIVVINHAEYSEDAIREFHETAFHKLSEWAQQHSSPRRHFEILYQPDLPKKKAGVGLARKMGMDEAVRRFAAINKPDGVLVCLDADCRVEQNYLKEIEQFFAQHPHIEGSSIQFAHPLNDLEPEQHKAIIDYELHLRYYINIQRWAGFPFAYQTIGSSMAVRADVYCKVGGMNTHQAGEDFYFLHKVIERGAFAEINTTTVFPSPRASDRVPFGTGRAVLNQIESREQLLTYHPKIFHDLRDFFQIVPLLRNTSTQNVEFLLVNYVSTPVRTFLIDQSILEKLSEINANTSSDKAFLKRFFRWFNAFMLMKFVHYARDHFYPNIGVPNACMQLVKLLGIEIDPDGTSQDLLQLLRESDKGVAKN